MIEEMLPANAADSREEFRGGLRVPGKAGRIQSAFPGGAPVSVEAETLAAIRKGSPHSLLNRSRGRRKSGAPRIDNQVKPDLGLRLLPVTLWRFPSESENHLRLVIRPQISPIHTDFS